MKFGTTKAGFRLIATWSWPCTAPVWATTAVASACWAVPQDGSDFVTAPELTPLFGETPAKQVAQALDATGTDEIWEFGAGTGALAEQLMRALGDRIKRFPTIVDLSGSLRDRQHQRMIKTCELALRWCGPTACRNSSTAWW